LEARKTTERLGLINISSSLGIPSTALPLLADDERAKAGDLNLLSPAEPTLDRLEDDVHETGGLTVRESAMTFVDYPRDVGLGHEGPVKTMMKRSVTNATYARYLNHYMSENRRCQEESGLRWASASLGFNDAWSAPSGRSATPGTRKLPSTDSRGIGGRRNEG
jgi:hypothetical protein